MNTTPTAKRMYGALTPCLASSFFGSLANGVASWDVFGRADTKGFSGSYGLGLGGIGGFAAAYDRKCTDECVGSGCLRDDLKMLVCPAHRRQGVETVMLRDFSRYRLCFIEN